MAFLPGFGVLLAYTIAVVFLTLTPGPDMALYLGKTVGQGRAAGFAAFAGTAAGLVVHSTLAAVGLSAVLAASATAFTVLKIVGAGYLLYLAVEALRRGAVFTVSEGAKPDALQRVFLKGMTINVLNPKIIVFFATFLPQFIEAGDVYASPKLFFLGIWYIVVTIPLTVAMILGAARIAAFLRTSRRALRVFDTLFAGVMAAFAVRLLLARSG
jgi:threonine/homoserine/homoserine lactone efflux protein